MPPKAATAPTEPDWAAIREDYEAGEKSLAAICRQYGITIGRLRWRARCGRWSKWRRSGTVDRRNIIARLFHLIETQTIRLEQDMTTAGDKEAAVLGRLASTLEKLIEIESATRAVKGQAGGLRPDMKELRDQLVKRIAQLKRG